jgi:hypothetical protein
MAATPRPGSAFAALSLGVLLGAAACSSGGSGSNPDGGGAPVVLKYPWDWVGVVGTGQSLSVGGLGTPITGAAMMPSFNNLKLALGGATVPPFDPTLSTLTMAPLDEPIRPDVPAYPSAYPGNIDGETPHTVMASQITWMVMHAAAAHDYLTVHTVVGESGQPMSVIDKAATEVVNGATSMGRAYAATRFEAAAIARLAAAVGKTYGIGAIMITHGEADAGNLSYESDLVQLWSDYNADLPLDTGQSTTTRIPMLVSQQSSNPTSAGSTSASSIAQWQVGVDHPGDIICIGPKYQYPYVQDSSGFIHLSAHGYELLGEKYGQVFFERVVKGSDWQPLQPTSGTVAGKIITLHFHVPVPPLVWNDFPPPHTGDSPWAQGRGFELRAASASHAIDSVAIVPPDMVQITSHDDLSGLAVVVSYAATTDGVAMTTATGNGTYRWGQLSDSDPFVGSVTGVPQPNPCVAFTMSVQ